MKINRILVLICVLNLMFWNIYSLEMKDFQYYMNINGRFEKDKIYSVELDDVFLSKSMNRLQDIRIFEENGVEIPYVILKAENKKSFSMSEFEIIDFNIINGVNNIIVKKERKKSVRSINYSIRDKNFNRNVKIYGSNNNRDWTFLSEDRIFDYSNYVNLRKTYITLDTEKEFTYFRFEFTPISEIYSGYVHFFAGRDLIYISKNFFAGRLKIDSINYTNTSYRNAQYTRTVVTNPDFTVKDKVSVIDIKLNTPLKRIDFGIKNKYFDRNIKVYIKDNKDNNFYKSGTYKVHRKPDNDSYTSLDINREFIKEIRIEVENGDNIPLEISHISFLREKTTLYFMAVNNAEKYIIYTGNEKVAKPSYDVKSYINNETQDNLDVITLSSGDVIKNPEFDKKDFGKKLELEDILKIVIVIIVIIAGNWIYILHSNKKSCEM